MSYYDEIKAKQAKIEKKNLLRKRSVCEHHFDEITYSKKCVTCGTVKTFRNPDDIRLRGEMGDAPDYN